MTATNDAKPELQDQQTMHNRRQWRSAFEKRAKEVIKNLVSRTAMEREIDRRVNEHLPAANKIKPGTASGWLEGIDTPETKQIHDALMLALEMPPMSDALRGQARIDAAKRGPLEATYAKITRTAIPVMRTEAMVKHSDKSQNTDTVMGSSKEVFLDPPQLIGLRLNKLHEPYYDLADDPRRRGLVEGWLKHTQNPAEYLASYVALRYPRGERSQHYGNITYFKAYTRGSYFPDGSGLDKLKQGVFTGDEAAFNHYKQLMKNADAMLKGTGTTTVIGVKSDAPPSSRDAELLRKMGWGGWNAWNDVSALEVILRKATSPEERRSIRHIRWEYRDIPIIRSQEEYYRTAMRFVELCDHKNHRYLKDIAARYNDKMQPELAMLEVSRLANKWYHLEFDEEKFLSLPKISTGLPHEAVAAEAKPGMTPYARKNIPGLEPSILDDIKTNGIPRTGDALPPPTNGERTAITGPASGEHDPKPGEVKPGETPHPPSGRNGPRPTPPHRPPIGKH